MTQVIINITNTKKWDELKPILESLDIDYFAQDMESSEKISEIELELFNQSADDVKNDRLFDYSNSRQVLLK